MRLYRGILIENKACIFFLAEYPLALGIVPYSFNFFVFLLLFWI